jgi:hypothetical protein
MKKWIPYLGLVSTLVVSYALDYGVNLIQEYGAENFILIPYLWGSGVANLILAFLLFGLTWLVYIKYPLRRIAALIFALIGLSVTFYPALTASLSAATLPKNVMELFRFSIASAFIGSLGIVGSLIRKNTRDTGDKR